MHLSPKFKTAAFCGGRGGALVLGLDIHHANVFAQKTITATVMSVEAASQLSGIDNIVITDKGSFTVDNDLTWLKFNATDQFNKIKKGCTYEIHSYDWANTNLGNPQNIDFVKLVSCPKQG